MGPLKNLPLAFSTLPFKEFPLNPIDLLSPDQYTLVYNVLSFGTAVMFGAFVYFLTQMKEVNEVQVKFEEDVKTSLNTNVNPFELIYEGELVKQG